MVTPEFVESLILTSLHSLAAEVPQEERFAVGPDTVLFGVDAQIDSLSLVSLIVDIESALNGDHGFSLSLTDDRAMTRAKSPFTDVQALKEYILELVQEAP